MPASYCKVCGKQTTDKPHKHLMSVGVYLGDGCWLRFRGGQRELLPYRVRG